MGIYDFIQMVKAGNLKEIEMSPEGEMVESVVWAW